MRQKNMVNASHFVKREISHPRTGINQQIMVKQERRGSAVFGNGSRTAEYTYFHEIFRLTLTWRIVLFGFKIGCAIPFRIKRQQPHRGYTLCIQPVKELFAIYPM